MRYVWLKEERAVKSRKKSYVWLYMRRLPAEIPDPCDITKAISKYLFGGNGGKCNTTFTKGELYKIYGFLYAFVKAYEKETPLPKVYVSDLPADLALASLQLSAILLKSVFKADLREIMGDYADNLEALIRMVMQVDIDDFKECIRKSWKKRGRKKRVRVFEKR